MSSAEDEIFIAANTKPDQHKRRASQPIQLMSRQSLRSHNQSQPFSTLTFQKTMQEFGGKMRERPPQGVSQSQSHSILVKIAAQQQNN